MAEVSLLWSTDGTGDGSGSGYTQANVNIWQRMLWVGNTADEGVCKGYLNELAVTNSTGRTMSVNTGGALVYGFPYWNTAATTVDLTHPTSGTTGYRIVLRASYAAQTIRVTKIQSADGTATIPAMTQNAGVTWDIPLAEGTITTGDVITVTDDRVWLHPNIEIEAAMIAAGTRIISVPCTSGWNVTDNAELDRTDSHLYGMILEDAHTTMCFGYFYVPADFVSGGVVIPVVYAGGTGNLYASQTVYFGATTETPGNVATAATTQAVTNTKLANCTSIQTTVTGLAAGDHVMVVFQRVNNAADTVNADCQLVGFLFSYTGKVSS